MRLKAYKSIGDPQPIDVEVNVVVLEGELGQPVVVAADLGHGQIMAEVAKPSTQDEFNRILRALGFDKLVIVDNLEDQLVPIEKTHELPDLLGGGPKLP